MSDLTALTAARTWASNHGHPQPDDRMLRAYGTTLLTDLADRLDRSPTYPPPTAISEHIRKLAADLA